MSTTHDPGQDLVVILDALDKINSGAARLWYNSIDECSPSKPKALRNWLKDSDQDMYSTLQMKVRDGKVVSAWEPGFRELELFSTYMELDGSARYFAGVHHVAHSDETWIGYDTDMQAVLVYGTL